MYYYKKNNTVIFSSSYIYIETIVSGLDYQKITSEDIQDDDKLFYLFENDPGKFRSSYTISSPSSLLQKEEDIELLCFENEDYSSLDESILRAMTQHRITAVNTSVPSWEDRIENGVYDIISRKNLRVNIIGLGDVGGTLLLGLKLRGFDTVSSIGIYDKNIMKLKRYEHEIQQIYSEDIEMPQVNIIEESQIFDCDVFVFAVAFSVPPVGNEIQDVRMMQLEKNAQIIDYYAKAARYQNFKGLFAVMSDPVDQLCQHAFLASNSDENGNMDYKGLSSEQIKGFGLGVMNARAVYYSLKYPELSLYKEEGRAYGPHGNGLVIANSVKNYNERLSQRLTELTVNANLEVRATGFKPYMAPAISSGCLSMLACFNGQWHYSSSFIGGKFFGARNRFTKSGLELEKNHLPKALLETIAHTYNNIL